MNISTWNKGLTLAFFVYLSCGEVCAAGFHVWIDESGRKQVSTIPRNGFNQAGEVRRPYDPNSLTSQYHEMRRTLALQAAEITRQQIARERIENQSPTDLPSYLPPQAATAPREGIMDLRDLIQLESRGGRYSQK